MGTGDFEALQQKYGKIHTFTLGENPEPVAGFNASKDVLVFHGDDVKDMKVTIRHANNKLLLTATEGDKKTLVWLSGSHLTELKIVNCEDSTHSVSQKLVFERSGQAAVSKGRG
jgi:hypothetical protein